MMFKEGTCPICHEKIQVPEDREQIICMFCGKEISVDEALGKENKERREIGQEEHQEYESRALARLKELITTCDNPMNNFKRTRYESEFEEYYASNRELFEALDMLYIGGTAGEQTLKQMADCLIETAREQIEQIRFKGHKTQKQLDYNFMVSVYLIPSIRKYPADFSEPFADCLVQSWNEAFGTTIGKASFDDINKGFRRKLCYVTTAICENLGKGPDCYELKTLKDYRDQYMEKTPEGHALVDEYYDIAPTIVKRMERQPNRDQLYKELYEQYLVPCIHEIEAGKYEECCKRYEEMVLDLKSRYLN